MSKEDFRADLHCHSTYSDGSLTPAELVQLALKHNLQGLSITDHDSVAAYPEALTLAKENQLLMVPGVEFSTQFQGKSVHILGYSFDFTHPKLLNLCQKHKLRRLERNLQILEKLRKEGFLIEPDELFAPSSTTIGRPHIAQLLVKKGYLPDVATAFQNYLGDQKKCYVAGTSPTLEDTIETLHAAQGLCVIAHPHVYHNHALIKQLLTHPFDGIEVEYGTLQHRDNRPWIKLAKERKLITTAGSDFHGSVKPMIPLGASTVGYDIFEQLLTRAS